MTQPNTTTFNPTLTAQQTVTEIENTLVTVNETEAMLGALQSHYESLHKNQQLYIEYLTEFVDRLKTVQKTDKESFANLKKEVIKHVLNSEKKQAGKASV